MGSAMYSGISGLKANQARLDVVGNNIANVNTTAFKSQRIKFQNTLSQNIGQATGPSSEIGGTNPKQIGLGVQIAGIDTFVGTGNMQPTSRDLDFAIDGEGYFVVGKGGNDKIIDTVDNANTTMDKILYTRDGTLNKDSAGNLLTADGYRVMGYALKNDTESEPSVLHEEGSTSAKVSFVNGDDITLTKYDDNLVPLAIPDSVLDSSDKTIRIKSYSVDSNGVIKAVLNDNRVAALGQIAMVTFKNPAGLNNEGSNLLSGTLNSGAATYRTAVGEPSDTSNEGAYGSVRQNMLEMSNVDLAEQFTDMIVASRAFQANGKIITTSDEILQDLVNLKR